MQYPQTVRCLLLLSGLTFACSDDAATPLNTDGGTDEGCVNTPGNMCVNPIRFDFDPSDVDIVGDLKKEGIDFAEPKDGFQLTTQGVRMAAGEDDEWCEAFEVPADPNDPDREWCITHAEVAMTEGFHHLFVAKAPVGSRSEALMEVGERVRCIGGAHVTYGSDLLPIPLPQGKYVDVKYYKGVGERFKAGEKISINYHYLNAAERDIIAVTKLNFHASSCDGLRKLDQFGYYNQDISIPAGGTYSTEMTGTFSQDVYVLDIFRHTHRFGRNVPVSFYKGPRDGEVFFDSPDYEQGASFRFPEPVLLKKGEGFKFVCNFENPTDKIIHFGPTADEEMCMLLGTWWVANQGEEPKTQHRYKW
jgi:Copper type II ascorbate-dependent monooxygenase, C-terminal domain